MNRLIISAEKQGVLNKLRSLGFEITETESIKLLPEFERTHADMQCLRIGDVFFVLKDCARLCKTLEGLGLNVVLTCKSIESKYPGNVLLNAAFFNNRLYGRLDSVDKTVLDYCDERGIEKVNVNQGYAKCSTALLGDRFITADKGIFDAMSERGERGLLISPGGIELKKVDYGFIGGCSFELGGAVYFAGDISKHPDFMRIQSFLRDKKIVCLTDERLYDIGGVVAV